MPICLNEPACWKLLIYLVETWLWMSSYKWKQHCFDLVCWNNEKGTVANSWFRLFVLNVFLLPPGLIQYWYSDIKKLYTAFFSWTWIFHEKPAWIGPRANFSEYQGSGLRRDEALASILVIFSISGISPGLIQQKSTNSVGHNFFIAHPLFSTKTSYLWIALWKNRYFRMCLFFGIFFFLVPRWSGSFPGFSQTEENGKKQSNEKTRNSNS